MTTKLFERLVTKFSIKVTDLIKYLEISKATIYNYRNLENFSDIPKDKQYKIFYLFGKETEEELILVLDESDPDVLAKYVNRISSILKGVAQEQKESLASMEELEATVDRLCKENASLQRQLSTVQGLNGVDEFTRTVLLDKVAAITNGASTAEIKEFIDYLDIFEKYKKYGGKN
jgi:ACT domain-containing protein